ncbi:MAG: AAC(3) family N-acetyltransferase, partial [Armatimonadota bacterium]
MQPEAGDRAVQVTREDVTRAAREIGITPGDTLFFHSSLSSMGHVIGGPDAVIDGFLDAVGPEGTVAAPTLCDWEAHEQHLVFERWDPTTSPSFVGAITERFRQRPDAIRSDHATHSVAAIGARAEELTAGHG